MDTFQGLMHDPMTLHKYLYTPSDPVNFTDPSGRFFGFTIAQNINAALTTASIVSAGYSAFQIATGEKELTAKQVGITVLILVAGPAAGKLVKLVSNKFTAAGGALVAGSIKLSEALIERILAGAQYVTRQKSVSIPKIERFVEDMLKGGKFPPIKVDGNVIVEGRHRYIASKIAKVDIDVIPGNMPSFKRNDPVHELVDMIFSKVDF